MKKIFSEVMEYNHDWLVIATEKDIYLKDGYLHYEYQDPNCTMETYITIKDKINIYEFSHKCKEYIKTLVNDVGSGYDKSINQYWCICNKGDIQYYSDYSECEAIEKMIKHLLKESK
jgi:hypothetical protein